MGAHQLMSSPGRSTDPAGYSDVLRDSFARLYDRSRDSWTREPAMQHVVQLLISALGDPPGRVLDVGAGRGRDTEELLAAGHRVTAVDLVRLPEWNNIAERWGERATFRTGDVRSLPEGDRGFDGVLDNGVLHHQRPEDYAAYLAALRRRLSPDGLLALSLFVRGERENEGVLHRDEDGRFSREFTDEEARELLAAGGFRIVSAARVQRRRPEWAYLLILAQPTEE
jgi:SAM-dependent methyltransferase